METGSPNLDCMSPDDLMDFWARTNSVRPLKMAREIFPSCPAGYVRATKDLGCYASNKATAMCQRSQGNIAIAQQYEDICDRIYAELPDYAKW
jgi:hypothetical protein